MKRLLLLLAVAPLLLGQSKPVLVPDVSARSIEIRYSFTGAQLLLFGAILILFYFGGSAANFFADLTRGQLGGEAWLSLDRDDVTSRWAALTWDLGKVLLPMLGLLLATAVAANLGQIGFLWLPQKLALDITRHREVEHHHRAVFARSQCAFDDALADNRQRTRGAAHHDIVQRKLRR